LAARNGQGDREEHARQKAKELEHRLTRIQLEVPDQVAAIEDLVVEIAGVEVSGVMFGESIPVDAGPIEVIARAPGYRDQVLSVEASSEGETYEGSISSLEPLGQRKSESSDSEAGDRTPAAPRDPVDSNSWQPPTGWALVGLGVVGLGVGGVTGIVAQSKYNSLDCPGDVCSNPEDEQDVKTVNTMRTVSPIGFIAGGVLAAAGATLILTAPGKGRTTAYVAPYLRFDGEIGVQGAF
jgi:hypothetical protein